MRALSSPRADGCLRVSLAVLVAASLSGAPAEGARRGAQPLILLFHEGYGIVAAEVVEASKKQRRYPYRYRVTFLVHEIIAQPIKGAAFPLGANQTLATLAGRIISWMTRGKKNNLLPRHWQSLFFLIYHSLSITSVIIWAIEVNASYCL